MQFYFVYNNINVCCCIKAGSNCSLDDFNNSAYTELWCMHKKHATHISAPPHTEAHTRTYEQETIHPRTSSIQRNWNFFLEYRCFNFIKFTSMKTLYIPLSMCFLPNLENLYVTRYKACYTTLTVKNCYRLKRITFKTRFEIWEQPTAIGTRKVNNFLGGATVVRVKYHAWAD